MLRIHDVFDVLNWAAADNSRFGDTAVDLGLLTETDVQRLLQRQRQEGASFEEVLIQLGFLDEATVNRERALFQEAQRAAREPMPAPLLAVELPAPAIAVTLDNRELVAEFIVEATEHLEAADRLLLALEANPEQPETLNALYRAFHSIKGVSSFFSLEDLTQLAHAAEELLNLASERKLVLTAPRIELIFGSIDALKRQIQLLREALAGDGRLRKDERAAALIAALQAGIHGDPVSVAATPRKPLPPSPPVSEPEIKVAPARGPGERIERESVRVDRDRLDKLVNVIGELVIGEAMVEQEFSGHESRSLLQLSKIVRDLQELSLTLRMVPIGGTFQRMARIVRDLARKLGKQIAFQTEGEETELDKTVVDHIGDPLMHMVRNAADHGIEMPADREAAGKPSQGRIRLRAYHQGGNIYIELSDDGQGLQRDVILRKAIERGLVREDDKLTDAEICNLIFMPGFSTAAQVTDVSGRGVGMDVVRKNVEALQGSVSLRSEEGKGSTVTIRLPLTLAILDGLLVGLGTEVYIIPLLSVVESFRPRAQDLCPVAGHGLVLRVRGELVPLLRLERLLHTKGHVTDPTRGLIVIVEDQGKKCGLLVDEVLGQQQVVIKNLEANFQKVEGIAGATILGDGRVALILDTYSLTRQSVRPGVEAVIQSSGAAVSTP